jgi:hypothetical protein
MKLPENRRQRGPASSRERYERPSFQVERETAQTCPVARRDWLARWSQQSAPPSPWYSTTGERNEFNQSPSPPVETVPRPNLTRSRRPPVATTLQAPTPATKALVRRAAADRPSPKRDDQSGVRALPFLSGLPNVPAFSCGRQSEPQASDKPVCCNARLASAPRAARDSPNYSVPMQ